MSELAPEEVRWFYRLAQDKPWLSFDGYDSLRIEIRCWQTLVHSVHPLDILSIHGASSSSCLQGKLLAACALGAVPCMKDMLELEP